jgi:hypothetical protein
MITYEFTDLAALADFIAQRSIDTDQRAADMFARRAINRQDLVLLQREAAAYGSIAGLIRNTKLTGGQS